MTIPTAAPGPQSSHRLERPTRLVPAVVDAILDRIVVGEFAIGTLMPKESELTTEYGVSRTVIREALRVLEEKGLIAIQQGRGTTVNEQREWNLLDPLVMRAQITHDDSLRVLENLAEVRAAMEAELTRVATPALQAHGIAELSDSLARLTAALDDPRAYLTLDQEFHDIILKAAGNPVARQIVRSVHGWNTLSPHAVEFGADAIAEAHRGHCEVFDLIQTGASEAAAERMRQHIQDSWVATRTIMTHGS